MQVIITVLHVLVAVSLIGLVLVQHGKGADAGAAFGSGASNTMFGSAGSTPFLVKLTGLLAAIFFMTSLVLSYFATPHEKAAGMMGVPTAPVQGVPPVNELNSSLPSGSQPKK